MVSEDARRLIRRRVLMLNDQQERIDSLMHYDLNNSLPRYCFHSHNAEISTDVVFDFFIALTEYLILILTDL